MIVQARELRRYAPLLGRPAMMLAAADEIERLAAKLEAAEKERDELRAALQHEVDCVEAAKAKIAGMEQQESIGVLHVGSYYGEELQDWEFEANQCACDKLNEAYVHNPTSLPLYTLPGAQPAPSVSVAALRPVIDWLRNGCDPMKAADELEMLAAAPEAKPTPSVPEDVMRDAERYRYLRARDDGTAGVGCWIEADGRVCDRGWLYGVQLDSAIDSFIEVLAAAPKPEAKP